jgi:hypothetical protein
VSKISVEWQGMDRLIEMLIRGGKDAALVAGQAMLEEAQLIFLQSQRQVPYLTGALSGSGGIDGPTLTGDGGVEVEIGYGGPAAPYALIVHEKPATHRQGKKDHYLSDPVEAAADGMASRIANRIQQKMGSAL